VYFPAFAPASTTALGWTNAAEALLQFRHKGSSPSSEMDRPTRPQMAAYNAFRQHGVSFLYWQKPWKIKAEQG
jgi:hypothetical protein